MPAVAFVVGILVSHAGATVFYAHDDGSAEDVISGGEGDGPAALWWVQGFTTQSGGEVISSLNIMFGRRDEGFQQTIGAVNGEPVKVLLYEDPTDDLDPSDAVLLISVNGTVRNANTDTFVSFPIEPTRVRDDFFVGAVMDVTGSNDLGLLGGGFPAALDQNPRSARASWVAENTVPGERIDPRDVANTSTLGPVLIDDVGFLGNWMIRATGKPIPPPIPLQAGDADQDLDFDQIDLVQVQISGKYLSGRPATWGEGDWNAAPGGSAGRPPRGDGLFNQLDILVAQVADIYLTGPYAAILPAGRANDRQTSIVYDSRSGELRVDTPVGIELTSIHIDSAAGIFTVDVAHNLGGSFDNDTDNNLFKATFGSSFGRPSDGQSREAQRQDQRPSTIPS